jgi:ABC-2 type transport system ATP-binding protein
MVKVMNAPIVQAEQLTKHYRGERGVHELTFDVGQGEVFGYLGPNGAGKTTTIRLLIDLIRPSSGRMRVFGLDPRRSGIEVRRRVGYLPGDMRLYERLTGREQLRYFASLRGMDGLGDGEILADRFDLDLDRRIQALSRGNRQKIGLVQAFMHRPDLLVLDEPTSGLDPLVQQEFYDLVAETTADGRTVFLSSHVLPEVQRIADRVAVLREGRLELLETVEAIRARAFTRFEVSFAEPPPPGAFEGLPAIHELERRNATVVFALEGAADPLVKAIARFEVIAVDVHEADLEDLVLALYRGDGPDAA